MAAAESPPIRGLFILDGPFFMRGAGPGRAEEALMCRAARWQLRDTIETPCDRDPIRTLFCLTLGGHGAAAGRQAVNENFCQFDGFICNLGGLGVLPIVMA